MTQQPQHLAPAQPRTLNPGRRARAIAYVGTAIGSPVVAYLNARGVIGDLEVALWAAETAVVAGMAALNTPATPTGQRRTRPRPTR